MANAREIALDWLIEVVDSGASVNQILSRPRTNEEAQSLARQMLFGSLRFYHRLRTQAEHMLEKPFKAKDQDLTLILVLGLYQLQYLSTPDHAAISETVELTRYRKKPWASGLVNGILRRFQRESKQIAAELDKSQQYHFSHPGWIVKRLREDWADRAESILHANNTQAPMTLRTNRQKNDRLEYLEKLEKSDMPATPHILAGDALVLEQATDVHKLPGFEAGCVSVQDAAAQLAVDCLALSPGLKVLDACAAPGGKTTHILQREPSVELTAVELSEKRAERIDESLKRLGVSCKLKVADLTQLDDWWDGELFDRILLDVPCSASGVIRRNPDIKIHRRVTDIRTLTELQLQMLDLAWSILKPGGILVYATCSVFKAENETQIASFMARQQAQIMPLPDGFSASLNRAAEYGQQIFPGELQMDGFYLCALAKKPLSD